MSTPMNDHALAFHFADLPDPRIERSKVHSIQDIITIAICATIAGADGWVHVKEWAETKDAWLRTFLDLGGGIPSHDTFGRVFGALDPVAFQSCFARWVHSVFEVTAGHVAIDGKRVRRSLDTASGTAAIHMVSAWSSENQLVLAQVKTAEKSNEIKAIPALLDLLELTGCIVILDAMGTQKEIARIIVDVKYGDYVLALKGNQPGTGPAPFWWTVIIRRPWHLLPRRAQPLPVSCNPPSSAAVAGCRSLQSTQRFPALPRPWF